MFDPEQNNESQGFDDFLLKSRSQKLAAILAACLAWKDSIEQKMQEKIASDNDAVDEAPLEKDYLDEDYEENDSQANTADENPFNAYDFFDSDNLDRVVTLAALYKFLKRKNNT